jgi:hypothetical protein
MGRLSLPEKAKLFCGLLISPSCNLDTLHKALEDRFGPIDSVSKIIPFDFTDYYTAEMGPDLKRQFVSFEKTVDMESLAEIKTLTNILEKQWAKKEKRTVNIDPGYLTLHQIVLASTKKFYHRIYLRDRIHAEVTLHYRKGKGWTPFEWTYPDYRSEITLSYFARLRESYQKKAAVSSL